MELQEAKKAGALAMFGEKYEDTVRVLTVDGGVSKELCGGTHVQNTSEIGGFKIVQESGIASGIRRIEAVAGQSLVNYLNKVDQVVKKVSLDLNVQIEEIPERLQTLQEQYKKSQKQIESLKQELAKQRISSLIQNSKVLCNGVKVLIEQVDGVDQGSLQKAAQKLIGDLGEKGALFLGSNIDGSKCFFVCAVSKVLVDQGVHAGKLVGQVAKICGGGGGGKPNLAQAGAKNPGKIKEAMEHAQQTLRKELDNLK